MTIIKKEKAATRYTERKGKGVGGRRRKKCLKSAPEATDLIFTLTLSVLNKQLTQKRALCVRLTSLRSSVENVAFL